MQGLEQTGPLRKNPTSLKENNDLTRVFFSNKRRPESPHTTAEGTAKKLRTAAATLWALLTQLLQGFVCGFSVFFSSFGFSFTWFRKNERGRASYPPQDDSSTLQRLLRVTAADFSQPAWKCPSLLPLQPGFFLFLPFLAQKNCTAGVTPKLFPEPGLGLSLGLGSRRERVCEHLRVSS